MSAHEILQRMEKLQAARAEAITPLAEIQEERAELLRRLASLDEPYGKAYAEAEVAGWSPEELAEIGIDEPLKRPKGRPRTRKAVVAKKSAAAAPGASPAAAIPAQDSAGDAPLVDAGGQSG
ncbi:hypothetical protein ACFWBC_10180 [Streptomyces sp. NPDC059985]|uniref:hypothetical protein n=1 Tax=Streptomyces sp. NPDC059985 TaxID=3347025 RepID=UPI0036C2FA9C